MTFNEIQEEKKLGMGFANFSVGKSFTSKFHFGVRFHVPNSTQAELKLFSSEVAHLIKITASCREERIFSLSCPTQENSSSWQSLFAITSACNTNF